MLLTAGHDLDKLHLPLVLDVSTGDETYTLMRGTEQQLKAGDMYIRDGQGILSDVIYGPDKRSSIDPNTRNAIYTVYAPAGIPQPCRTGTSAGYGRLCAHCLAKCQNRIAASLLLKENHV